MGSNIIKIDGKRVTDDRGSLSFINEFDPMSCGIRRFYVVRNHRAGFIRAWHGHENEGKYVYVVNGTALIKVMTIADVRLAQNHEITEPLVTTLVLTADNPQVLYIPEGYFNGVKTLTDDAVVMFFSNKTLEESKGDDIRLDWDEFGSKMWGDNFR